MPSGQIVAQQNWRGDMAGPAGPTGDGIAVDIDAGSPRFAPWGLGY